MRRRAALGRVSVVHLERSVGDLDEDPVALDDHVIDGQRQLGRWIERLAAVELEPRQVERAGERAGGQEALVELEVLVTADALDSEEPVVRVDDGTWSVPSTEPSLSCLRDLVD